MIASENFVSEAVLEAAGSIFTNKYAEGYPGRRSTRMRIFDVVENLARDRAKQIFGAEYANVQPHSGSQANAAAYAAVLQRATHSGPGPGSRRPPDPRASAQLQRQALPAHVLPGAARHGADRLRRIGGHCGAGEAKAIIAAPRLSAAVGLARMRQIADKVGAVYIFDMAHIAGLVAGGVHPSPVPHAHITTTTTHKTLRGPRAGLILAAGLPGGRKEGTDHRQGDRQGGLSGQQGGPWCTLWRPRQ